MRMPAATTKDAIAQRPARKRNRDAFERSVAVFRAFRETATPEEMERIASRLEQALTPLEPSPERAEFLKDLTGGRTFSEKERLELEAASIARYFQKRQELLQGSLSAPQVARLLGTTRQTPHDRAQAGTLLAVRERGGLRFPRWQFDPEGPDGVLAGLPEVLKALDVSPLAKVSWFVRPNPYLEGRTPLEALKGGEGERLVAMARGVGVS
jgi:hypothetical protein